MAWMHDLTRVVRYFALGVSWLVLLLFVAACSAAPQAPEKSSGAQGRAPRQTGSSEIFESGQAVGNQPSSERMIVRNVNLSLSVGDIDAALAEIAQVATEFGGFVVSADSGESDGTRTGKASLRVSSDKLDEAVGRIKALARQVRRESRAAKDVTEEYVDQDARLRNLQATESQYLQVLNTAKSIDEILTVRKAVSEVRDQIERTQARLEYLRRSTDMALISVDLDTSATAQSLQLGDWDVLVTVRQAVQGQPDDCCDHQQNGEKAASQDGKAGTFFPGLTQQWQQPGGPEPG